jgi:hypothetical protein
MKIYRVERADNIIRLSFNAHISISFEETTIEEVYNLFLKAFENVEVESCVLQHNVLKKPMTKHKVLVQVRNEGVIEGKNRGYKGVSKSKTLYGIREDEAKKLFLQYYNKNVI